MIVLDTHVWVWWVHGETRLLSEQRDQLLRAIAPDRDLVVHQSDAA